MRLAKPSFRRLVKLFSAVVLGALVGANGAAFMQVWAMTHFAERGERTARPERLSLFEKVTVFFSGVNIPRPQNGRTPDDVDLAYGMHHFASSNASPLEAWHIPGMDALPVIALFHGYAASKSTLLNTARAFHQLGYATLLVDFYGSGGSSGSGTTIGVKEADDVTATVEYMRRTWPGRRIVLYGISMGGAAVLRAIATNAAKPDTIIIEATFDRLLNTGKNRFRAMGLPGSPFAEMLLFWGSVQNGFNMFTHNPADYARAVKLPALILHGERDARATFEQARSIAEAMEGKARLIAYPEVPHMPIVEARPEDWTRDVAAFLEQVR